MRTSVIRAWLTAALVSAVLVPSPGAAGSVKAEPWLKDPLSDALVPRPELSPEEVIRIQLEALRHNDERDRGIAVAFRFASPANRANTGPLPRFIQMIEQGPYALMLAFREASYGAVELSGESARQRVTLTGTHALVSYWFYLSRQSEEPYVGCWMTDAVYVERAHGRDA